MSEERVALPSIIRRPGLALPAACALFCASALAQDRGRLVGVEAGGDAAASSIELIGDRPLSFTTLKLRGPPRVVVDFADTELGGISRQLAVDDGTVRRVAAAIAGQRTARVVIELAADAEFEVRAQGNRVQVRVPRIAPLVASAAPAPVPPPAANASVEPPPDGSPKMAPAAPAQEAASAAAAGSAPAPPPAPERPAGVDAPVAAKHPGAARKLARATARHAITGIGFRPIGAGEVIVRSDHALDYGVTGEGAAVLLHLPGSSIALSNNRRALDTRFFAGPVERVVPVAVEGGTDVRIELRGRAEYQLVQSGNVLTVTFSAPR